MQTLAHSSPGRKIVRGKAAQNTRVVIICLRCREMFVSARQCEPR